MAKMVSRRTLLMGIASGSASAVLLGACGQAPAPAAQPEQPKAAEAKPAAKPAEAPAAAKERVVRYLHYSTQQKVWDDTFNAFFKDFEAKHPGIKLQIDTIPGTGFPALIEKAVGAFAAKIPYDLYYGHFSYISQFATAEMIQPLDPLLAKDTVVKKDDYFDWAMERIKGKTYSIAWFTNGKETWYNADLLAEAGLTPPKQLEAEGKWTWDTLVEYAKKLKKVEGQNVTRWGFNYPYASTGWFWAHLMAWGADWWNKDFTAPAMNTQEFGEATQYALDMVIKHQVSPRVSKPKQTDVAADFTKQGVAMLITGSFYVRTVQEQIMTQPKPFKVEMTMLPKGPKGRQVVQSINANWISSSSPDPDAAWAFYKFWLGKEGQQLVIPLGGARYNANKNLPPAVQHPYEDAKVYSESAKISVAQRQIVRQGEVDKAWTQNWKDMEDGVKTVKEAQAEMQKVAEINLKEGGCIC